MSLILIRHGKSLWNLENRFTGWKDIDLSNIGEHEAQKCGDDLKIQKINIDYCFTSDLLRAKNTAKIILNKLNSSIKLTNSEKINERDYGDLSGMNKDEARKQFGVEQVHKWRRDYYERPPNGENLEDVVKRVGLYYDTNIKDLIKKGKNVLVVAHGNSLRALMVHLKYYSEKTIINYEIETACPIFLEPQHYYFSARQILDSRGFPTIEVKYMLNNQVLGKGSSPSGASCGSNEALELRDNVKEYMKGKSVLSVVQKINNELNDYFENKNIINLDIIKFDALLNDYDNSEQKVNIGGNTTTALSFCMADVYSKQNNMELYEYLSSIYNNNNNKYKIPTPMVNIINGGKHAGGSLKIQEFMIMPNSELNTEHQMQIICEIYYELKECIKKSYGKHSVNIGDEGGFAPDLKTTREALNLIIDATKNTKHIMGQDVFITLDCAASEFYDEHTKLYEVEDGLKINSQELVNYYESLINEYTCIKSIEDPFHESDYDAWIEFMQRCGDKIMIVGDDLYTTNPKIVKEGIEKKWANSLLLKVNQIGTISEAIVSAKLKFNDNKEVIVSHRSGETNQDYIIDLAVGIRAGYVKIGAPARGERVSKFNRLMEIFEII